MPWGSVHPIHDTLYLYFSLPMTVFVFPFWQLSPPITGRVGAFTDRVGPRFTLIYVLAFLNSPTALDITIRDAPARRLDLGFSNIGCGPQLHALLQPQGAVADYGKVMVLSPRHAAPTFTQDPTPFSVQHHLVWGFGGGGRSRAVRLGGDDEAMMAMGAGYR